MIDRAMANRAADTLAVVIAAIMEEAVDVAIRTPRRFTAYHDMADVLASAGEDVVRLAAAMAVIVRRSGEPDPG